MTERGGMGLREIGGLLVAMKSLGEAVAEQLSTASVQYSSALRQIQVLTLKEDFEVGGRLPAHRLILKGGTSFPWQVECYAGEKGSEHDVVILALLEEQDVFGLAIDENTAMSPGTERYFRFLMAEKTRKEREASGVAGN